MEPAISVSEELRWLLNGCFTVSLDWLKSCASVYQVKQAHTERLQQCSQAETYAEAVSCLCLFMRDNFCGPPGDDLALVNTTLASENAQITLSEKYLNFGYEVCDANANNLLYLALAKWTLLDAGEMFHDTMVSYPAWTVRLLRLWQQLFSTIQNDLAVKFGQIFVSCDQYERTMTEFPKELQVLLWLEVADACCNCYRYKEAREVIQKASDLLQLKICITGAMGRRTKFQTFDCPQTVLQVLRSGENVQQNLHDPSTGDVPRNVTLNDDTLLERLVLTENTNFDETTLNPVEQCLLLTIARHLECSTAHSCMKKEEIMCYLQKVIDQPTVWSVQSAALFFRSKLEMHEQRRFGRAVEQTENQLRMFGDGRIPLIRRFPYSFSCVLPSILTCQRRLAWAYVSFGYYSAALEIFYKLNEWAGIITCYKKANLRKEAKWFITDLLAELKETPALLCHLGDVTDDVEQYRKAWQLSGQSYAPAKRKTGFLKLRQGKYNDAVEALQLALDLQPLDLDGWFNLGFCHLKLNQFEKALVAFQRVVMLDPDYAEAWSNLALAALHLTDYERAYQVLQDAIRCSYENKKIWLNFVTASYLSKHFDSTVSAIHHLLDREWDFGDFDLVRDMTIEYLENHNAVQSSLDVNFKQQLRKLLARLTAKFPESLFLWRIYGMLYKPATEHVNIEELEKYAEICEKAHRNGLRENSWKHDSDSCNQVIEWATNLLDAYWLLFEHGCTENANKRSTHVMFARSAGESALKRFDQAMENTDVNEKCSELYGRFKKALERFTVETTD